MRASRGILFQVCVQCGLWCPHSVRSLPARRPGCGSGPAGLGVPGLHAVASRGSGLRRVRGGRPGRRAGRARAGARPWALPSAGTPMAHHFERIGPLCIQNTKRNGQLTKTSAVCCRLLSIVVAGGALCKKRPKRYRAVCFAAVPVALPALLAFLVLLLGAVLLLLLLPSLAL